MPIGLELVRAIVAWGVGLVTAAAFAYVVIRFGIIAGFRDGP